MQMELLKWAISTGVSAPALFYIAYHFWKGKIPDIQDKQEEQDKRMKKMEAALVARVAWGDRVDSEAIIEEFGPDGTSPSDYVEDSVQQSEDEAHSGGRIGAGRPNDDD